MSPERCKKWPHRVTFLAVIIYEQSMHRHIGCVDLLSSATGIFWVRSDSFTVMSILTLYCSVWFIARPVHDDSGPIIPNDKEFLKHWYECHSYINRKGF